MAKRARLLVYDGPEEWLAKMKASEYVQDGAPREFEFIGASMKSYELDPDGLTSFLLHDFLEEKDAS